MINTIMNPQKPKSIKKQEYELPFDKTHVKNEH